MKASATLTHEEHERLKNDMRHLDARPPCIGLIRLNGTTTIITATTEVGAEYLRRSLKEGLMHTWGYGEKFRLEFDEGDWGMQFDLEFGRRLADLQEEMRTEHAPAPRTYDLADEHFPITPVMIPSDYEHLWGAFGNSETEVSARYVHLLAKELGGWKPFTEGEITAFYRGLRKKPAATFCWNRLVESGMHYGRPGERHLTGGGWVVRGEDGKFRVTEDFIMRVYISATKP